MLDKIKVYKRSDTSEINHFSIEKQDNNLLLSVYQKDHCIDGENCIDDFELSKTDPLNKFKKEMDGWWFCEECVVIIGEKPYNIKYAQETLCYRPEFEHKRRPEFAVWHRNFNIDRFWYGDKFTNEIKEFAEVTLGLTLAKYENGYFDRQSGHLIYYSIGEEKYLKLLELVGDYI